MFHQTTWNYIRPSHIIVIIIFLSLIVQYSQQQFPVPPPDGIVYNCHGFLSNDSSVCSGHGQCIAPDHCSCYPGYASEQCEKHSCFYQFPGMVQCNNHGTCVALNTCNCTELYTGKDCAECKQPFHAGDLCEPIQCFGIQYSIVGVCSGHGQCIKPNNCSCDEGFIGERCEQFTCLNMTDTNSTLNNTSRISCSGHGQCVGANTCQCYSDSVNGFWSGLNCDKCQPSYGGIDCKEHICDAQTTCHGRGECTTAQSSSARNFFSGYQIISKPSIRAQNFRNLTIEGSIASEGAFSVQILKSAYGQVNIKNNISKTIVNSAIALYQELSASACDQTLQQSVPSGGLNVNAGVYCFPQGLNGGGKITVSGLGRVILVLKTNLNYGFSVEFINGATQENLFWVVGMGSSIGGKFYGNLVTAGQINVNNAFISGSLINVGGSEMNLNGASFGPIVNPPQSPCTCFGNFASPFCESCIAGFYGENCTQSCSPERNCNGRGQCSTMGTCVCAPRFTGTFCEACSPKWVGKNCDYLIGDKALMKSSQLTLQYANPSTNNPIDCSLILMEESVKLLGNSPQCKWQDISNNSFIIELGNGNSIYEGSILKFKVENGGTVSVPVQTDPNTNIPPTPILRVSSKISKCGRLELDASSSYSADKKSLEYKYEVVSAPSETDANTLKSELSFYGSQAVISISAAKLNVGKYVVKLIVSSPVTGSSFTTSTIEVYPIPGGSIDIPGGLNQTFTYGSVVVINPQIIIPYCSNLDGTISNVVLNNYQGYSFSWEQVGGESIKYSLESNNRILLIQNIQKEGDFTFKVKSIDGFSSQETVHLSLKVTELVLKVKSGNFLYGKVNEAIIVDFSESYDPSNTQETEYFKVACIPLGISATCPNVQIYSKVDDEKKFTISENSLIAGLYQFTITYSKGSRSKSETVVVNLVEYVFLNVFIKMASNDFLPTSVPLGMNVSLVAVSPPDLRNDISYIWSSKTPGFILNDQTTLGVTSSTLTILSNALQPDTFYTIRLDASSGGLTGSSEYYLSINTPPKPGYFTINPLQSKSGVDTVTLSCGGWSDENTPLSYQFFFNDVKTSSWQILTGKNSNNQVNIMLPPGSGPSNQLTIKARVYDSTGAFSEMQQVVISN